MSRIVNIETLPNCEVVVPGDLVNGDPASIGTKLVYGNDVSLRVAVRHGGYHSRPHIHGSEQLNYLAEGELWIYVEGDGYHLRAGDFMRVPRMAVHWAWNRSDQPCVLYESHCPPNIGNPRVRGSADGLFGGAEPRPDGGMPQTIFLSERYAIEAEAEERPGVDGGLLVRSGDLDEGLHSQMAEAGHLSSKFVYGREHNLMIARRGGGYHSKPHIHDCEQLNYLVEGELWIFLDDAAYHLRAGDFMRVPRMVPHWAWNPASDDCVLVEAHSPVLDPGAKPYAKGLFLPDEKGTDHVTIVKNLWSPETLWERESDLMNNGRRTS